MIRSTLGLAALAMLSAPAGAAPFDDAAIRPAAFIGLRLQASLGGSNPQPRAGLTFAPAQTRFSSEGRIRTRIGDGVMLGVGPGGRLAMTIAGRTPGQTGFAPSNREGPAPKQHLSTGGWVAVGVATVAIAAAGFALWVDEIEDNSD